MLIIAINFENSCSCSCVVPDTEDYSSVKRMKKLLKKAQNNLSDSFIQELLVVRQDKVVIHWRQDGGRFV